MGKQYSGVIFSACVVAGFLDPSMIAQTKVYRAHRVLHDAPHSHCSSHTPATGLCVEAFVPKLLRWVPDLSPPPQTERSCHLQMTTLSQHSSSEVDFLDLGSLLPIGLLTDPCSMGVPLCRDRHRGVKRKKLNRAEERGFAHIRKPSALLRNQR